MIRRSLVAVLACAFVCTPAISAQKKKPATKPKPTVTAKRGPAPSMDIAGLSLGKPLSIPECPSENIGHARSPYIAYVRDYSIPNGSKPCWQHWGAGRPGQYLAPDGKIYVVLGAQLPGVEKVVGTLIDGALEKVTLLTVGERWQHEIDNKLREKYGSPTSSGTIPVENHMGASFTKLHAEWNFTDLTVFFSGIVDRIDSGLIVVSTPKADVADEAARATREAAEQKF